MAKGRFPMPVMAIGNQMRSPYSRRITPSAFRIGGRFIARNEFFNNIMSTNIVALSFCAGGGHILIGSTGEVSRTFQVEMNEIQEPITPEEMLAYLKVTMKLRAVSKTTEQITSELNSGIVIQHLPL